ncbi:MAG: lytic transglycosylase domain-containing protein [Ferrovibrio sp.]|uniref:lytic transglycosylase domain-containing protein n=1 Tax=Ferrovibrio sp. TaxID=1917215 RepID=UPI00260FFC0C|nr:lytic transglycosylase domain-containing protein [Ferrovibrio sp.]MCW0236380.1 lytic transglycosylase domain-containing protein [Ferrovibrio sp.]
MPQDCIDCPSDVWRRGLKLVLATGLALGWSFTAAARQPTPETKPTPELASTTSAAPLPSAKPRRGTPPARPEQTKLPAQHEILSASDREIGRKALQEAAALRFDAARRIAATAREPMIAQLTRWLWLQSANSGAGFEEITSFIETKPDWPAREALLRRAEEAMDGSTGDGRIIAWFDAHPPETGLGLLRLGESLLRLGREKEAFPVMRRAWVDGNLALRDEKTLWAEFGDRFSAADNAARTDRLLWDGNIEAARRMLPRLNAEARQLAEARIALANNVSGAEKLVAALPAHLRDDGGLNYDRLRWQRKRGMDDVVEALLYNAPEDLGRAEKWWVERHFRARKAMAEGRISEAYRLAAGHGVKGGAAMAEAEWLAGWIALRLLQEPKTALKHFVALQDAVRYPVSLSRAAYWLGRTYTALGDAEQARHWYSQAAQHGTTFYGQLGVHELDAKTPLDLPDPIRPTAEQTRHFQRREVVRAAQILVELDMEERLRPFIIRLVNTANTPEDHKLVAQLARNLRRVDLAVASSKRSARQGVILVNEAYPLVEPMLRVDNPETALVLALSRQESEFNQTAVSPAGARGLMQLMPATAKGVAKDLKLGFDQGQLTQNAGYNVQLGAHYLKSLLQNWDNNYVLALVGYNAGEARVRRWIRDWGDPRQPNVDVIDWIELIPFSETRNYVQRVLEGVQVYRSLLHSQPGAIDRIYIDMRGLPRQACSTSPC